MDDDRKWERRLFAAAMALAAMAEVLVVASGQARQLRVQEEQACVAALDALAHQLGDEQPHNMALLAIAGQRCRETRSAENASVVATLVTCPIPDAGEQLLAARLLQLTCTRIRAHGTNRTVQNRRRGPLMLLQGFEQRPAVERYM